MTNAFSSCLSHGIRFYHRTYVLRELSWRKVLSVSLLLVLPFVMGWTPALADNDVTATEDDVTATEEDVTVTENTEAEEDPITSQTGDTTEVTAPNEIVPDASAQEIQKKGQQLVDQAYEMTKTAQQVEDFQQIIDLCKQAMLDELSDVHLQYTKRLLSWSHNKRGEARADEASEVAVEGDSQRALELDELALNDFEISILLDKTRWRSYHNRGVSFALRGDYEKATRDFEKTIELRPGYVNAWFNLGEISYDKGEYDQAIEKYDEVIRLRPKDAEAYRGRANSYSGLRLYRKALSDFDKAVTLNPENAVSLAERADTYSHLGDWRNAAANYRQAIELNQNLGRAYQGAAWIMATCPIQKFRDKDRALKAASRAIELDGDQDFRYLDTLAAAHAANENYEEAISYLEQAIDVAPELEREQLEKRRTLYESAKPYRQASRLKRATRS